MLACKAQVNFVDSHDWTPLFWAVQRRDKKASRMTQLLLDAKANPEAVGAKQPMSLTAFDYINPLS